MNIKMILMISFIVIILVGIGCAIVNSSIDVKAEKVIQDEEYVANEKYNDLKEELILTNDNNSFLINGELVPEEIRVESGTNLSVNVINDGDYETSLHFHGINGLSKMDGVGGVSQNNIKPGESFEYKFTLDEPGTYMYHSHVDSQNQVNNENLYDGLVVEGDQKTNEDMLLYNTNINDEDRHHFANLSYDEVLVNGNNTDEYKLDNDENLFLNISNLSSAPISINFGNDIYYRITSIDANEASSEWQQNQSLIVPTAQRLIVEIENPQKSFQVSTSIKDVENAQYNVIYKGDNNIEKNVEQGQMNDDNNSMMGNGENSMMEEDEYDNLANNSNYIYDIVSTNDDLGLKDQRIDKRFNMELSLENGMWVIDDEAYPNT